MLRVHGCLQGWIGGLPYTSLSALWVYALQGGQEMTVCPNCGKVLDDEERKQGCCANCLEDLGTTEEPEDDE